MAVKTTEEVLAESTKVAQEAARVSGVGTFSQVKTDPVTGFSTGGFKPITSSELAPTSSPTVTPQEPLTLPPTPVFTAQQQAPETSFDKSFQDVEAAISSVSTFDREGRVLAATQDQRRQIAEIDTQIQNLDIEKQAALPKAEAGATLQPFAEGEARRRIQDLTLQQMRLGVQRAALAGEANLAAQLAGRAVDVEFADQERKLNAQRANLLSNYDDFTPKEQKRADALLLQLGVDFNDLQALKKTRVDNSKLAIQVALTGRATQDQLRAITEAPDEVTAASLAAPFLQEAVTTGDFTLGAGQTRFDAQGNVIAVGREGGGGGGGGGIFKVDSTKSTIQNNMLNLQEIFKSSEVSAGNKTSVGNGLALAQAAQDLANANIDGKFSGFSPFRSFTDIKIPFTNLGLPFRQALKRNKTVQNEALISALDLQTQFWASGAALSEEQTKLVRQMIPTVNNTDTQIRTKVNQLINYMLSQTSSRLITDGLDFQPQKVDVFETVKLLEQASPEQQAQLKAAGLIP